jgi:hypothetical protein
MRDESETSVQVAEHARLCRQLNMCQYLRGIAEGSNSRLRKAIEGAIWLMKSMGEAERNPGSIVMAVERRLTEAMELDAQIREQEGRLGEK